MPKSPQELKKEQHLQNLMDRNLPAVVRFWKRVNKNGPVHPTLGHCWDWTGYTIQNLDKAKGESKYGCIGVNSTYVRAHKFSWELHNGCSVPEGKQVLHRCDRPICVNPNHLYAGTRQDNINDMSERNRIPIGEEKWSAKLTEDQIREIRKIHVPRSHTFGSAALGKLFGVSGTTIQTIIDGKKWGHVT